MAKRFQIDVRDFLDVAKEIKTRRKSVFTNKDLVLIADRIRERLFVKGLNSDDKQMRQAKTWPPESTRKEPRGALYRFYRYRYHTGQLVNSLKVEKFRKYGLRLTWNQGNQKLQNLIDRYGQMFDFSPSDIDMIEWVFMLSYGLIPENTPMPTIRTKGAAPYRRI